VAKTITLKVAEAGSKDVGRGIVRFDPFDFRKIGVEVGEVVTIKGKRDTVAKVLPAYMEDRGKDFDSPGWDHPRKCPGRY